MDERKNVSNVPCHVVLGSRHGRAGVGYDRTSQFGTGSCGAGKEGKKDMLEADAKLLRKRKIILAFHLVLWYYFVKAGCKQAAKRKNEEWLRCAVRILWGLIALLSCGHFQREYAVLSGGT